MTTKYLKKGEEYITACMDDFGKVIITIAVRGNYISNPTLNMLLSDGWEDVTPEIEHEESVEPTDKEVSNE